MYELTGYDTLYNTRRSVYVDEGSIGKKKPKNKHKRYQNKNHEHITA